MTVARGGPGRWPLRVRVAAAFVLTAAFVLVGLAVFVQVRVAETLEERLRDTLEAESARLAAMAPDDRAAAVGTLGGETYAEVLDREGSVVARSPQVVGPLLDADDVAAEPEGGDATYVDAVVTVRDAEEAQPEEETALLLVSRDGEQVVVTGTSRDDTDEAVAEVRTQLLIGVPVALLAAGLLGYVVAGVGLRPIERMRARAATISARSAGERLPLPAADDELRRLAETLNAMLERLDDALQRERRFVAEASHELRTPLALMLTEIELALDRPRPPEELVAALRSTEEETRRLIDLAEDLLLLAAADVGRLRIDAERVDLVELARVVAARFAPSAGGRSITVIASLPTAVTGDRERLDQVVSNLVDNALRHGDGAVEIEVASGADPVTLTVVDHGGGFDEERPFDRFAGAHGSVGLGLAIVREIVRAHGGRVETGHDAGPDTGLDAGRTWVRVELPARASG